MLIYLWLRFERLEISDFLWNFGMFIKKQKLKLFDVKFKLLKNFNIQINTLKNYKVPATMAAVIKYIGKKAIAAF